MRLIQDLVLTEMSIESKRWLARAIAGTITADGVVATAEMEYLREALELLENKEEANALVQMVKTKQKPQLECLRAERKLAATILLNLARLSVADGKLATAEVEYLKYAASKIGFESKVAFEVIKWANDLLSLQKKEADLRYLAENAMPVYKNC